MTVERVLYRGRKVIASLIGSEVIPQSRRVTLLRALGATACDDLEMFGGCRFHYPENLTIGERVFIGQQCYLDSQGGVTIEDDVSLGPRVVVLSLTHSVGHSRHRAGWTLPRPTVIGRGVWVGAAAVILPGVTVAPGCIVGAGAVVTGATDPDGLYLGNPARRVRDLPDEAVDLTPTDAGA